MRLIVCGVRPRVALGAGADPRAMLRPHSGRHEVLRASVRFRAGNSTPAGSVAARAADGGVRADAYAGEVAQAFRTRLEIAGMSHRAGGRDDPRPELRRHGIGAVPEPADLQVGHVLDPV